MYIPVIRKKYTLQTTNESKLIFEINETHLIKKNIHI